MSQRFEGKNLEEALNSAREALGVDRFQLTYHVLLEKRGFLGGVKRVVIEADVNREAQPPVEAPPVAAETSRPHAPSRGGAGRGPRGGGQGGRDRDRGRGGRSRGNGGDRGDRVGGGNRGRRRGSQGDQELRSGDFERFSAEVPQELLVQTPESEGATTVRAWIQKALDLAKLDMEIRTQENDTQIIVRLFGLDAYRLVDHHGELLDALQVLANKSLTGRKVEKDIELDCEQFKERRVEELGQKARELADQVRQDGREQLLPAMSPIERRIVHLALQDDAEVATESRGEGFYKRIAVIPKPAAKAADDSPES
jgi:predicted RNA-binding protein Jag